MAFKLSSTSFKLLPEHFPLIASHLPLYAAPPTLLALGLTNKWIFDIVHNLLYSRLVLRNEKDAIIIFQRILADPSLGREVRELHVMSELSVATMAGETMFDTVTGLQRLVSAGALPHIHTLELHLTKEGIHEGPWCDVKGFGHLSADFWQALQGKCPRLGTIILSGIGDRQEDPWLNESGIYELKYMKKITHLGLSFSHGAHAQFDGTDRLLRNVSGLAPSLHTLVLSLLFKYDSASPLLTLDFPYLQTLCLRMFSVPDTSQAMAFWRRHPLIEKLKLSDTEQRSHWFSTEVEETLLPNLKYLEASFHDVRSLMPVLPRLTGLSIQQSVNAQVPYLLRQLIPYGLPHLKSLEIDQESSTSRDTIRRYEGSAWFETLDGRCYEEKRLKNSGQFFSDQYIHSISKGAPNIVELCFHGISLYPSRVETFAPHLAIFPRLERLYYRGLNDSSLSLRTRENQEAFYKSSRFIAEQCKSLNVITDISSLPYTAVKIRRSDDGTVEETIPVKGRGMLVGAEDEAFPCNPDPIAIAG